MKVLFKSIRWRLQIWHGAILLLVLVAFGCTAFYLVRDSRLRRIDRELQRRLLLLSEALRPPSPREGPPFGPRAGPGLGPRRFGDGLQPDAPWPLGPVELRLPADQQDLFAQSGPGAFYFVVWSAGGEILRQSATAPADVPRPLHDRPLPERVRMRGDWRELIQVNRRGPSLVVGRSVAPDRAELRRLAWLLALAGAGVLVVGLAGGWWLASRAIRPIEIISAAAHKITAGNLTERVHVSETDSELGQLAQVLNTSFDRLQAAWARQVQFTADASHELRTPMSVILSQTQTILARERSAGEYRESLEICQRAAQRMRQLLESLLILARLDSGEPSACWESCALDRLTSEALSLLEPLAAEHQVTLHAQLAPAQCAGDAEQLGRLATNLVANGIFYNRPGGEVRVEVKAEEQTVALIVSDTGEGIATEDQPHIFERFYRADKSRARARGRTGLGLAIVRAIVETHRGSIHVSSEPGKGSTFTVRLPRASTG
jgi:two-component system OmpR family sensor kinase